MGGCQGRGTQAKKGGKSWGKWQKMLHIRDIFSHFIRSTWYSVFPIFSSLSQAFVWKYYIQRLSVHKTPHKESRNCWELSSFQHRDALILYDFHSINCRRRLCTVGNFSKILRQFLKYFIVEYIKLFYEFMMFFDHGSNCRNEVDVYILFNTFFNIFSGTSKIYIQNKNS